MGEEAEEAEGEGEEVGGREGGKEGPPLKGGVGEQAETEMVK